MEQILAIFLMIGQIMDISFYYLRLLAIIFYSNGATLDLLSLMGYLFTIFLFKTGIFFNNLFLSEIGQLLVDSFLKSKM